MMSNKKYGAFMHEVGISRPQTFFSIATTYLNSLKGITLIGSKGTLIVCKTNV